jgi:hypothetical protein
LGALVEFTDQLFGEVIVDFIVHRVVIVISNFYQMHRQISECVKRHTI